MLSKAGLTNNISLIVEGGRSILETTTRDRLIVGIQALYDKP
jgi:hypothetical protein